MLHYIFNSLFISDIFNLVYNIIEAFSDNTIILIVSSGNDEWMQKLQNLII